MEKIHVHLLDLKSYYSSPAYQLGLLVAYASLEGEVKKNVEFTFTEHPREQPVDEIADVIMAANSHLVPLLTTLGITRRFVKSSRS